MHGRFFLAALVTCALCGCGHKPGDAKADTAAPTGSDVAPAETGLTRAPDFRPHLPHRVTKAGAMLAPMSGDSPELKEVGAAEYPEAGIDPINPSCERPWVVLHAFKGDHKSGLEVDTVLQVLYVNPAFKAIDGEPRSGGEVVVEIHSKNDDSAIIARCHDAGTCTRLAAMIKAATKWDTPKTGCGDLPSGFSSSTRLGKSEVPAMPSEKDKPALCARLGACKIAKDPGSSEDPIGACQRSPSSFNVSCALKPTCEEVLSCH